MATEAHRGRMAGERLAFEPRVLLVHEFNQRVMLLFGREGMRSELMSLGFGACQTRPKEAVCREPR